jgi:DNA polymerase/3'-5' exonuclease PolX
MEKAYVENVASIYVHAYNKVASPAIAFSSGGDFMSNREMAIQLTDYAHFLETRGASLYRVKAYRKAAETLLGLPRPIEDLYETDGRKGIQKLPSIGSHLSYTIEGLIRTGEFQTLDGEEEAFGLSRCLGCG